MMLRVATTTKRRSEMLEIENSENSGFTAPPAAPGQAESRKGKAALDALLTATEPPEWKALYEQLLNERNERDGYVIGPRWDWRKALYIAWSVVPKARRQPATEEELAVLLNLKNTRTIRMWKQKFPEIEERIAKLPKQLLMTHLSEVYDTLVAVATMPIPAAYSDRRLYLELVGEYQQKAALAGADDGPVRIVVEYANGKRPASDAT